MRLTFFGLLLASLLLTGCGSSGQSVGQSSTPTKIPTPTAPPMPTAVPTAAGRVPLGCYPGGVGAVAYQVGDLFVGVGLTNMAYPARQLPATAAPNAPFPESQVIEDMAVSPKEDYTFGVVVCNTSKNTSHTIEQVQLRIAQLTPQATTVKIWDPVADLIAAGGGVGGGFPNDGTYQLTFSASAGAGAVANSAFVPVGDRTPLPHAVAAGNTLVLGLSLKRPSTAGTYAFEIGLSADGQAPTWLPIRPLVMYPGSARVWSAANCNTPAMQSQIPAGSTTRYICPPGQ